MYNKAFVLITLVILIFSVCLVLPGCDDSDDVGLSLKIPEGPIVTNTEYTFVAESLYPQFLSENPYYDFDFDDVGQITVTEGNQATHTFVEERTYKIRVEVFETDNAEISLGVATATVTVGSSPVDFLGLLQQTNWIEIGLVCPIITTTGSNEAWYSEWGKDKSLGQVQWNGSNFSVTWSETRHSEVITGTIRQDGSDLYVSLKARHEFVVDGEPHQVWEIEISDLPLSTERLVEYGQIRFEGRKSNSDVPQYVSYFNMYNLVSVDWTAKLSLSVVFDKKTT